MIRCALILCLLLGCAPATARAQAPSTLSFPPEWAPHAAMWMAWPEDPVPHALQIEMIAVLAPRVPIRLVVESDAARASARDSLRVRGVDPDRVEFFAHPARALWMRDPGPRFLSDGARLAVADFGWNFYGFPAAMVGDGMALATLDDDLAAALGLPLVSTPVVAEGGAFEVSGRCLLGYADVALERNPDLTLEEIERELLRAYGKQKMIWLDRCPLSDRVRAGPKVGDWYGFGANGHIDEFVRFVNDSTLVVAQIDSAESLADPLSRIDRRILLENLAQLREARDPDGRPFRLVTLPVPALTLYAWTAPLAEAQKQDPMFGPMVADVAVGTTIHVVPAVGYLNFVITNGLVLAPAYWREGMPGSEKAKDEMVRATLAELFPGREVVQLNPLLINWGGGGMHCLTQQQPAVPR